MIFHDLFGDQVSLRILYITTVYGTPKPSGGMK